MLRSLMKVSGFTAISRVLGFLRDILIAKYLGSGLLGDAFFSAFRFPNLFRRIFGEGAFNAAFVPMFGRKLEQDGQDEAMKFASNAFSSLLVVLVAITIIAIPCMHWIMGAVVPGFKAQEELVVDTGKPVDEEFSVRIDGMRDVYLNVPNGSSEELKDAYVLGNLRFVKEEPRKFLQFFGDGERGESVPLEEVAKEYREQEIIRAEKAEVEPNEPILNFAKVPELLFEEKGLERWVISGGDEARIRLPQKHDYGWLEGTFVRYSYGKEGFTDENGEPSALRIYRNHPDTFDLTVTLSRITFCYLLFMALVAHLSGTLNTFKIFGAPAAAPSSGGSELWTPESGSPAKPAGEGGGKLWVPGMD